VNRFWWNKVFLQVYERIFNLMYRSWKSTLPIARSLVQATSDHLAKNSLQHILGYVKTHNVSNFHHPSSSSVVAVTISKLITCPSKKFLGHVISFKAGKTKFQREKSIFSTANNLNLNNFLTREPILMK